MAPAFRPEGAAVALGENDWKTACKVVNEAVCPQVSEEADSCVPAPDAAAQDVAEPDAVRVQDAVAPGAAGVEVGAAQVAAEQVAAGQVRSVEARPGDVEPEPDAAAPWAVVERGAAVPGLAVRAVAGLGAPEPAAAVADSGQEPVVAVADSGQGPVVADAAVLVPAAAEPAGFSSERLESAGLAAVAADYRVVVVQTVLDVRRSGLVLALRGVPCSVRKQADASAPGLEDECCDRPGADVRSRPSAGGRDSRQRSFRDPTLRFAPAGLERSLAVCAALSPRPSQRDEVLPQLHRDRCS